MYRKVPADLMEGTRRGSIISYVAVAAMTALFLLETGAYFRSKIVTDLAIDTNPDSKVRVNFNITMMDLSCDYAVVDVVSVLGTEQNVSSHINKWHVDAEGVRQRYQGRNRNQHDIELFDPTVGTSLEELYDNGEDAISLDAETFQFAKHEQEYLFVDFYASWYVYFCVVGAAVSFPSLVHSLSWSIGARTAKCSPRLGRPLPRLWSTLPNTSSTSMNTNTPMRTTSMQSDSSFPSWLPRWTASCTPTCANANASWPTRPCDSMWTASDGKEEITAAIGQLSSLPTTCNRLRMRTRPSWKRRILRTWN